MEIESEKISSYPGSSVFRIFRLLFFSLISLTANLSVAKMVTNSFVVAATENRTCRGYLSYPERSSVRGLYYQRHGTGLYSMRLLSESTKELLNNSNAARLVIDRPGIEPDETAKEGFRVDQAIYKETTHSDLIACTEAAFDWLSNQAIYKELKHIILSGHSEGTEVSVRAYHRMLVNKAPAATKVSALILTSVPMIELKKTLEHQFAKKDKTKSERFWKALKTGADDKYLIDTDGLSSRYLNNYMSYPGLAVTLDELVKISAPAVFQVFHGIEDQDTPVKFIQEYEKKNTALKNQRLKLFVRYYLAGHSLNDAGADDSKRLLQELLISP